MNAKPSKINTYVFNFFTEDKIVSDFEKLRLKIGVPIEGFSVPKVLDPFTNFGPTDWVTALSTNDKKFNDTFKKIDKGIDTICKDFKYPNRVYFSIARHFFFYNEIKPELFGGPMFQQHDLAVEPAHPLTKLLQAKKDGTSQKLLDGDRLPIVIKISPFITKTGFMEAIKKSWENVLYLQNLYTEEKVTIRKKRTLERDNFIYKNQLLPRHEISILVKNKYGENVDEILVRQIISKEKKRRKA